MAIDLASAAYPDGSFVAFCFDRFEAIEEFDSFGELRLGAANDGGCATGKRAADAVPGFASHYKNATHGFGFEPFEIFGDSPGNIGAVADDPVLAHGSDCAPGCGFVHEACLNGNRSFDDRIGIVIEELEVFESEVVDVLDVGIDPHRRKSSRFPAELKIRLLEMVFVKVKIAEGVDEVAGFESADLGDHHGEQRVAGDIEGDSEE